MVVTSTSLGVKLGKNLIFFEKNGKISKNYRNGSRKPVNFCISQMTKRTSPLDSSHKIYLPKKFSSHSEIVGFFHDFRGNGFIGTRFFMRISGVRK